MSLCLLAQVFAGDKATLRAILDVTQMERSHFEQKVCDFPIISRRDNPTSTQVNAFRKENGGMFSCLI